MKGSQVQTKRQIEAMLLAAGLRPKRRFGQHFLIDGNLMRRLVESADIQPDDVVLEVGAGTGGLTDLLVERAGAIVAVEVDRGLHAILADRFADVAQLTLIRGDALDNKNRINPIVMNALTQAYGESTGRLMLVANLPYDIATPLLANLLLALAPVRRLCFTVQREVGERIEAAPSTKAYGPLAIILQTLCRLERIARVPATAFWPKPAVESTMYRLDAVPHPFEHPEQLSSFANLVRNAFLHRRKTLRYNLARCLGDDACDAAADIVDLSSRPETIAPPQWVEMAALISANGTPQAD